MDFTKFVPLSELGLETLKIKAPLWFVPEPKGDGKFQFHQCADARCDFAMHTFETDIAGAQDKIGVAARFCINTTLTFNLTNPGVCQYLQKMLRS